jgi:hypothetical protein
MLDHRRFVQAYDSVTKVLRSPTDKGRESARGMNIPRLICSVRQVSSLLAALLWAGLFNMSVVGQSRYKVLWRELKQWNANEGVALPSLRRGSKCLS